MEVVTIRQNLQLSMFKLITMVQLVAVVSERVQYTR